MPRLTVRGGVQPYQKKENYAPPFHDSPDKIYAWEICGLNSDCPNHYCIRCKVPEIYNKLAQYENAEEDGLIKLPEEAK